MANVVNLHVNQSVSFSTLILDSYGIATSAKTINYLSNNPNVAVLGSAGSFVVGSIPQNSISTNTITALSNGSATITITINGDVVIDTIEVNVETLPPNKITIVFGTPTP